MKRLAHRPSLFKREIPFNPWVIFPLFLLSNALLSYYPLSLSTKLWFALLGILLPFSIALGAAWKQRSRKPVSTALPAGPVPLDQRLWPWFLFGALLLFTRFYRLTSLPFWPLSDEGTFSLLAMDHSQKGGWDLLWTAGRIEPLLIWSMGWFFRWVEPSMTVLRLYPALLSLGSVLLAYGAIRPFAGKGFSFVFCWLLAFSFWEFSLMRFCTPQDLIPFFQFLTLACLGRFCLAREKARWGWIAALTCANGLGFYSYINWAPVWFFVTLVLAFHSTRPGNKDRRFFSFFQISTLLLVLPLILARLAPGNLAYVQSAWGGFFSLSSYVRHFSALFWEGLPCFPFAPNWGGMLDPVTGSLILTGMVLAVKNWDRPRLFLVGVGLLTSLFPGTVTNYVELHRITPSLPFWILLAAFGLQGLIGDRGRISGLWTALFLLGPLALNWFNFIGPYGDPRRAPLSKQWRSVEYADAYRLLERQARQEGPLYVFSEFNTDYDNKTLNIACYPFDALQNPSLARRRPKWAALILNNHYAPYLIQRFPGLKFVILDTDKKGPGDPKPFALFLVPVSQVPPETLSGWIEADGLCRQANIVIKKEDPPGSWRKFSGIFSSAERRFPKDRLMKAIYWEKSAFFKYLSGDFQAASEDFQKAVQKGVPAAHLYYDLGVSLQDLGKKREGEKALKKAEELSKQPIF